MKIINFFTKKMIIISICAIICVLNLYTLSFALTKNNYEKFIEEGYLGISGADLTFNPKGQMYRKFGHFIIDGNYDGGDKSNPFYNEENSRDLAIEAADGDSTYDVYAEIEDDEIDYSYEDDEDLTATDYDRAAFQARLDAMYYGNTYHGALGYGKYNLRPGKNLTAFIKFAYDFYKNVSGDSKVGCKNEYDLQAKGITDGKICPMELLEEYAGKSYISAECVDGAFKNIWKDCTKHWEYDGTTLETTENIFEHLQDIFMAYVYLKPGVKKVAQYAPDFDYDDLTEEDYAAILSMMYERFGGRPINPSKVESGNAIPRIGTGDILATLVDFPNMSIADKIYTYMIEVKYKNNDVKLASWLKEYEDVMGSEYSILDSDTYDNYMKAYQKAFKEYGQDSANDTLLDYGFVLTPDILESKISYTEALNKFANTIRSHFGNSSFYNNRHNAQYVAKSYMMAKKMCENSNFSDITDIYACDLDVISHTVGYDSNMILLADTQVVELNDTYGTATDTDHDGILDYQEANRPELVDISNMVKEYCKYNGYTQQETEQMIRDNGKVTMYSYRSNPVLPDSDFDGRLDNNDGKPLDNVYNSKNETDNYSNISIEYAQDYRYFFMDDKSYYEELAEMGLVLSNMASKKNGRDKVWKNVSSGENYTANNLRNYMWYIGNDNIEEHLVKDIYTMEEEDVPYAIGQHDCVAILGKVNNLQKNIITLVIGENKDYKDILAANYDGSLGVDGSYEGDHHHIGYDVEATKIFENLVSYSDSQTPDWKKAYFIVGYGTGGSIANLVAKKMIDLKGNREPVFCYTYQAPNTINRNNLTKKIYNAKYAGIFNIENEDDMKIGLMGEQAGFTKYGIVKSLSVGDNTQAKRAWNKMTGKNYKSGTDFLSDLFYGLTDNLDDVFGFASTFLLYAHPKSLELAQIIYSKEIKDSDMADVVLFSYENNPKLVETAYFLYNKGLLAQTQSEDLTSDDIAIIQNLATKLQPTIDRLDKDKQEKNSKMVLNEVINLAKYYINYIGSYQGEKQLDDSGKVRATDKAALYYDYIKKYKGDSNKKYPFDIYDFPDATTVNDISDPSYITTEEQAFFDLDGKWAYYYDDFSEFTTEPYNVTSGGKTLDYNYHSHYIGDDCTGFSQGVIFTIEKNKGSTDPRGQHIESKSDGTVTTYNGLYNHNEAGWKYQTDKNTQKSLEHLGYTKLSAKNMTIGDLMVGDLLCSSNHVEYYVGNNYDVSFNDESYEIANDTTNKKRQTWKKSGISTIVQTGENTKTKKSWQPIRENNRIVDYELVETKVNGKTTPMAQGTFGWGGVNDEFPTENTSQNMYYFKKDGDVFKLYRGSDSNDNRNYDTVWRYTR